MTAPDLDTLIARARATGVRPDEARRYVAELDRWARVEPRRRRAWLPWLAGGLAAAAAAAVAIALARSPGAAIDAEALRVGERVAILAAASTAYRLDVADAERTEIAVDRGTVTARLWPGPRGHRLALRGGGVEAVASGTVLSLSVGDRGAVVEVHEGTVVVTRGGERFEVGAGATWPPRAELRGAAAARVLLALDASAPAPRAEPVPGASTGAPGSGAPGSGAPGSGAPGSGAVAAGAPASDATAPDPSAPAGGDARAPAPNAGAMPAPAAPPWPPGAAPARSAAERWRQARLLRGQGDFEAAVRECLAIADAKDPTWSPIALLEAARIELGPRAAPEQAVALAERFEAEWRTHELAPEARELRCRALRQLGRGAACAPAPTAGPDASP